LSQKGLLKRFSINCFGHQETVEEMRAEKAEKYNELKDKTSSEEYAEWFLRYRPTEKKGEPQSDKQKTHKSKTHKKKRKHVKTKKRRGIFFG
jgi:hypothetical protein